jgi:hypothetical protein
MGCGKDGLTIFVQIAERPARASWSASPESCAGLLRHSEFLKMMDAGKIKAIS